MLKQKMLVGLDLFPLHSPKSWWAVSLLTLALSLILTAQLAHAASYVVTTLADNTTAGDGFCTLREAIDSANNAGNGDCGANSTADDTITFGVSGTITLGSQLPNIVAAGTAGKLTIDGTGQSITISGNNSVRGFRVDSGGDLTLQNLTISNGKATGGDGGAILNSGTVTLTNSTLSNNSAGSLGGGIFNGAGSMVTLTNSTLSNNSAADGGAIQNFGTVHIINSTLSGNSATNFGGGAILNNGGGIVNITNSTLANNSVSVGADGGGIFNWVGTVTITNSTLSDNSAADNGGGIFNISTVTVKNTIVANSPSGGNCSNFGTFTAQGVNFATDATCPGFTNVPSTGAGGLNLGPLQNNSGPTKTHALLAGSVAINAVTDCTAIGGGSVTSDQRGVARPQPSGGNCDVGAYEAQFFTLTVTGAGTGNGTVTATGINCTIAVGANSGDCTEGSLEGTPITLTATPGVNSIFAGWSGHPDCNDGSVTMDADKTCTATFNLAYTLGDVNNDGKINAIDARIAQQHADGVITLTGNAFLAADVDTDGDVDSNDATAIAKKGIGLPTGIPGFALESTHVGARHAVPLLLAFALPALALLRRNKRLAMLLLISGLSLGLLTGCVGFLGLPPPAGSAIYLTSTSMPNGATRTIDVIVQSMTAQGGVAALQGRITYPSGVAIQALTGLNGFVVKALCGTVSDPCSSPGELRFSLVKPSVGGVTNGAVLHLAVQASGASGQVFTLSWAGSAAVPIVAGGNTNVEITGYALGNGQVKVR